MIHLLFILLKDFILLGKYPRMRKERNIDRGWAWVVLIASFFSLMIISGGIYSSPVFNKLFLDIYNQNKAMTSLAGAFMMGIMPFVGPLSSLLIHKLGWRITVITGGLIASLGSAVCAWNQNFYVILIGYGVLGGLGTGLAYIPSIVIVGFYFDKYRTLAFGLASSGAGFGMMLIPPLFQVALTVISVQELFILQSGLFLQICVCGALMWPIESHKISEKKEQNASASLSFYIKALTDAKFLLLCASVFFICFALSAAHVHYTAFMMSRGATQRECGILLILLGTGSVLSRLVIGIAGNHTEIGTLILYIGSSGITAFVLFLAPTISGIFVGRLAFAVLMGLYSNMFNALLAPVTVSHIGLDILPAAYGVEMFLNGLAFCAGPPIAGLIRDLTGSYDTNLYVAGLCYILGSLVVLPIPIFEAKKTDKPYHYDHSVSAKKVPTGPDEEFEKYGFSDSESIT